MAEFATAAMVHIATNSDLAEHHLGKRTPKSVVGKEWRDGVSLPSLARWESQGRITAAEAAAARAFLSRALEIKAARVQREKAERERAAAVGAEDGENADSHLRRVRSASAHDRAAAARSAKRRRLADLHKISRRALVVHGKDDHYFDWTEEGFSKHHIVDEDTGHPDHPSNLQRGLACCGVRWFTCRCCCCVTRKSHPQDLYVTRFLGGFGPDTPPIHTKVNIGSSTISSAGAMSSALYRLVIWIGYASGVLLATYGITFISVITLIFSLIYAESDCVLPAQSLGNAANGEPGVDSALTIALIALTQIVGGGTAPGTVRTDSTTCALASVAMSAINVGIRAMLFAAGLAALTDVESEVEFTSKICAATRDGVPTLMARFAFPSSVRANLSHVYAELTLFVRTEEGKFVSKHSRIPIECYPNCKYPVTASHAILRSSPLFKYVNLDKDGLLSPSEEMPDGYFTLHIIVYDTTTERYARRFRVYDLKSILYNQHFQDVFSVDVRSAVRHFTKPVILMKNMQRTVLMRPAVDRLKIDMETKEDDEDEDAKLHKRELHDLWQGVIGDSSVDVDVSDGAELVQFSPELSLELSTMVDQSKKTKQKDRRPSSLEAASGSKKSALERAERMFQTELEVRAKSSVDLSSIYIAELDHKELYLAGLSDLEAESLAAVVDKAMRPLSSPNKTFKGDNKDNGEGKATAVVTSERRGSIPDSLHMYTHMQSMAWDRSAKIQEEIAWRKKRDAQSRFPTCTACAFKFWSGRVCESRARWSLSYHLAQGFRGTLPEWQSQNFYGKNPLYTVRKCFHLGCLSSIFGSLLVLTLTISTVLALSYQAGDCFLPARATPPSRSSFANASNTTEFGTVTDVEEKFFSFGQALSSSIVQVGSGSPADPLRQHLTHCALLIMFAAAANVVMRVLVFSAFLHAIEQAKPEVIFTEKMVCNVREGCTALQVRVVAPTAHAIQIQSCIWRISFVHTTTEGATHFKSKQVKSHCPAFIALPMTTTHHIDHDCPLYQHFAATGKMPSNVSVVVSLGLWDVAKCRYFEEERMYSLERDIAVGFEFDNTVEVALLAAARRDVKPTINYTHFNKLRPSKFQEEDTSPTAEKNGIGNV